MKRTNSNASLMGFEFLPTLVKTGTWEAWTWNQLGQEIKSRSPDTLSEGINGRDGYLVRRFLGFNSAYMSAIDNVLSDLNEASGPVAIRDYRTQEVLMTLLQYLDVPMYDVRKIDE